MCSGQIIYRCFGTEIVFDSSVLKELDSYRQTNSHDKERGGLLLGKVINSYLIVVTRVVEIPAKKSGRCFFISSNKTENKVIHQEYEKGNYLFGRWHTHPAAVPIPSDTDIKSMKSFYKKSKHDMPFFIMVIVGNIVGDNKIYLGGVNKDVYEFISG